MKIRVREIRSRVKELSKIKTGEPFKGTWIWVPSGSPNGFVWINIVLNKLSVKKH